MQVWGLKKFVYLSTAHCYKTLLLLRNKDDSGWNDSEFEPMLYQHMTVVNSNGYLTFYYVAYGRIPSRKFHSTTQWGIAVFQSQRVTAAALQIRKARHKGYLHTGRLTFGERAMCRQQQEEAVVKRPTDFHVLISFALWGLPVFYMRKAVWAFKAYSVSKTSKQLC